jgi:anhydro-N-acetylmuramic acid kinase
MVYVIGLISGTSVDGIDAALVEISGSTTDLRADLIAGQTYPYSPELRDRILALCAGKAVSMADLADLDDTIARCFAAAAIAIQSGHPLAHLIGSHGQTVFHRPPSPPLPLSPSPLGYSLQLGRGALIAHLTGITTISNFRIADIAAGGQGAPLVPPIDVCLLSHPSYNRCVQNIGGIGNVTYLPKAECRMQNAEEREEGETGRQEDGDKERQVSSPLPHSPSLPLSPSPSSILGWDTGPGNALIDLAVYQLSRGEQTYDRDGAWAASGTPCRELVNQWLQQDFFQQPPPKSTGRELFGAEYFQECLQDAEPYALSPADILATLTELTAASIAHSYRSFLPQMPDQVLLCGGGSKNLYLQQRLQWYLETVSVLTTDAAGLNADFKEAIAFAVLAYWRQQEIPGNLPEVTGASHSVLLGEIYSGSLNPGVIA